MAEDPDDGFRSIGTGFFHGRLGPALCRRTRRRHVLAEGLQHLNQYQANWIAYRSTCEDLKHEKYLYLAQAGPYGSAEKALSLLAERIEGTVSQEHAKWVSAQQQTGKVASERRPGGHSPTS